MALGTGQTIGKQTNDAAGASVNASFATAPAAGSLVIVGLVGWHSNGYDVSSVTDNRGNSYSIVKSAVVGRQRSVIAYAANVNSSGTFTITVNNANGGDNYLTWAAIEVTGAATASVLDQSNTATDAGPQANDATVSTGTLAQADEFVFAAMSLSISGDNNLNIGTATTGYTNLANEQDFFNHNGASFDYKIVASTSAQSASWSHDDATGTDDPSPGGNSYGWTATIATFKAAGAPALFPPFAKFQPSTHLRM
jgi:hypothetical protein